VLSDAGIGGNCAGSGAVAKCQASRVHSGQTGVRFGLQRRPAFSCSRVISMKRGHLSIRNLFYSSHSCFAGTMREHLLIQSFQLFTRKE
jgi:hypothetical protein